MGHPRRLLPLIVMIFDLRIKIIPGVQKPHSDCPLQMRPRAPRCGLTTGTSGTGFRELRHFRPRFTEALAAAVAAYPEARVDVGVGGVTLHPSRPPVARLISPKLAGA